MAEHGLERSLALTLQRAVNAEKLATLLLLFILLTAATAGVSAVLTGPDWAALWESLLIGLLVGWGFAILRWPAWRSALFVAGLGLLFCLLFAGGLNNKILAVIAELFRLVGSIPTWLKSHQVDINPLGSVIQQLMIATGIILGRVMAWVKDLITSQPAFDPVAAGIVWSLVVWIVSAWAGWVVEASHNALVAVLPALSLNLITLSYGRSSSVTVYLMLGVTLVLIAVVQYDQRKQEWDRDRIAYPQRKGRQVGNTSLLLAIGLVILSAFIASLSLSRIVKWTNLLNQPAAQYENSLAKSLGIQQPTAAPDAFSNLRSPGLPRDLLIGSGPELSTEVVMSVQVSYLTNLVPGGQQSPFYWRSFTYDVYTGHGWNSNPTGLTQYQPGQPIQPNQLPDHLLIQEVISPLPGQTGTIYAAGEPVTVDVASRAAWRSNNDLFGIQAGDTVYTVQSLVPVVNEDSLRAAGQAYPNWVAQRYLSLPAEVPNRVKGLAIQLTASEPTPYDRARAIEQYLRSSYPYTTDVPLPPTNQDLADYFLFGLRKGYCDYYASAMVVLARAAGIPARLAIGYATGTYNLNSGRFVVTQAEAHSWVEVYFPGIGWVPFEPTAGRPAINRTAQPTEPVIPTAIPIKRPTNTRPAIRGGMFGTIIFGMLALAGVVWVIYDEVYLGQLAPQHAAVEIYRRMRRYGSLMKVPYETGQTPYEYGSAFTSRLAMIRQDRSLSQINLGVRLIVQRIVRLSYRPAEAGVTTRLQVISQWKSLRWQLRQAWMMWVWGFVRYFLGVGARDEPTITGTTVEKE